MLWVVLWRTDSWKLHSRLPHTQGRNDKRRNPGIPGRKKKNAKSNTGSCNIFPSLVSKLYLMVGIALNLFTGNIKDNFIIHGKYKGT